MQNAIVFQPKHGPIREYCVKIGDKAYRCSIGKQGVQENKQEGDNTTPVGSFPLRRVFYRPDKIEVKDISTKLPCQALEKDDAWCDDVHSREYNTFVKLPFTGGHEELWRSDRLYNLIVVVGYNDKPAVPGKGSAVFLHITREGYQPGAGCIGFEQEDLLEMLPYLTPDTLINISKTGEMELENYAKNAHVDLSPS